MRIIYSNLFYLLLVPAIVCMSSNNAFALTYGLAEALPGFESTYVSYQLPGGSSAVVDHQVGTDTAAGLSYSADGIECDISAGPYELHGLIAAGQLDSGYLHAMTSYRDQIYFETYNGEAAEIVFNFDLDLDMTLYAADSLAWAVLGMVARTTDNEGAFPFTQELYGTFHGTVGVSSLQDPYEGGLVLSGTYFTYILALNAAVNNATIDWSHSLTLNADNPYTVYQYDAAGNRIQLLPGQFTLTSQSASFPSTVPVPEPATVILLGSGLVGLAGLRKRMK